ncbi:MAG: DNA-directed RNA polymerase subunit K [Candidatus Thermoplasmatota archaeon]|nr:DNA-directed RNA polymerase subunit K [Candidatus Thermoplasmatota archaeon]
MTREYTRFEKARIIGARALQISMGAPTLLASESGKHSNPIDLAIEEFEKSIIPITVIREEEQ